MQQYMIQIINNLEKKGYKRLNPDSNNVYGRADGDTVYVVVIGSNRNLDAETLRNFNSKVSVDVSLSSCKKVQLLNILMTPDGMFDEATREIVDEVENVWLFSEDYGKLYIFENQPADFDGLYDVIDKKKVEGNERSRHNLRRMFGVVTPVLGAINVLVFLVGIYIDSTAGYKAVEYSLAVNVKAISESGQFYRLFTSMFTHFGIAHLFGNMVILVALGARVEDIVGRLNYVIVYIAAGLTASCASYISCYYNHSYDYAAGASGAIFGLLGVLMVIAVRNKGRVRDLSLMNMLLLAVLTIGNGYLSEGIDNIAHMVGFVAGIVAGLVIVFINQKVVKNSRL